MRAMYWAIPYMITLLAFWFELQVFFTIWKILITMQTAASLCLLHPKMVAYNAHKGFDPIDQIVLNIFRIITVSILFWNGWGFALVLYTCGMISMEINFYFARELRAKFSK